MARTLRINRTKHRSPGSGTATATSDLIAEPIGIDTGSGDNPEPSGIEQPNGDSDTWVSTNDDGIIDPSTITSTSGDSTGTGTGADSSSDSGTGKRGRGRPKGSGNGTGKSATRKQSATQATASLERLLFSVHLMGATFLNQPVMMLEESEAKQLAAAVTAVSELYELPFLDEKSQAWIGLGFVAATIYGPRIVTLVNEAKKTKGPQLVQVVSNG